jgi:hypothetical protein
MYKRLMAWTLTFLFFISLFACATLKDYKPKSKEDAAIKDVLVTFGEAENKGDVQGASPFLHESFMAPVGRQRTVLAKKEYLEDLPKRAAEGPQITIGEPQMTIMGNKADVKCPLTVGSEWHGTIIFHLVRENNKWLITGWNY